MTYWDSVASVWQEFGNFLGSAFSWFTTPAAFVLYFIVALILTLAATGWTQDDYGWKRAWIPGVLFLVVLYLGIAYIHFISTNCIPPHTWESWCNV